MKAAVITLYVSAVLLFSAFARAEMVLPFKTPEMPAAHVSIDAADLNPNSYDLTVYGTLPTPCSKRPVAIVKQDANDPRVLVLRFFAPAHTGICIQPSQAFQATVNLPESVQRAQLLIQGNETYYIKIEGSGVVLENVPGAELARVPGFIAQ